MKIDKTQLNIIKSYVSPPGLVVLVLQATCNLFGYEETWESAKRYLLGDLHFLEKLIEYDVKTAAESKFIRLRNIYISRPDFIKELVIKQSSAAASIYDWIMAINVYQKVIWLIYKDDSIKLI